MPIALIALLVLVVVVGPLVSLRWWVRDHERIEGLFSVVGHVVDPFQRQYPHSFNEQFPNDPETDSGQRR